MGDSDAQACTDLDVPEEESADALRFRNPRMPKPVQMCSNSVHEKAACMYSQVSQPVKRRLLLQLRCSGLYRLAREPSGQERSALVEFPMPRPCTIVLGQGSYETHLH